MGSDSVTGTDQALGRLPWLAFFFLRARRLFPRLAMRCLPHLGFRAFVSLGSARLCRISGRRGTRPLRSGGARRRSCPWSLSLPLWERRAPARRNVACSRQYRPRGIYVARLSAAPARSGASAGSGEPGASGRAACSAAVLVAVRALAAARYRGVRVSAAAEEVPYRADRHAVRGRRGGRPAGAGRARRRDERGRGSSSAKSKPSAVEATKGGTPAAEGEPAPGDASDAPTELRPSTVRTPRGMCGSPGARWTR